MSNSLVRGNNNSNDDEWLKTRAEKRLIYILSIQSHIKPYCPECGAPLTVDDEQIYCNSCGLVTQDSTCFNAGIKVNLPHGLRLG